jgi:hypothetical protein
MMSDTSLPYEIRTAPDPGGGLRLELWVEDQRIATATATCDVLDVAQHQLGLQRDDLAKELRGSLEALLRHQLDKVTVSEPREDEEQPLRFIATYTYLDHDSVSMGIVWYDVQASETGPCELPAVVRNQLRHEVHRKLTREGTHARAIVDLYR